MRTHLRLHRDPPAECDTDVPVTFRFPVAMASARKRLVAAVVDAQPTPGDPVYPRHAPKSGVLAHVEDGKDRTTSTDRLLRDVEYTLDDMQQKLELLKEGIAESFKFPVAVEEDDHRPRAA